MKQKIVALSIKHGLKFTAEADTKDNHWAVLSEARKRFPNLEFNATTVYNPPLNTNDYFQEMNK